MSSEQDQNKITEISSETTIAAIVDTTKKELTFSGKISSILIEIIAPLVWVYIFVKLFIYDFDSWFFRILFPQYWRILEVKFILLLLFLSILWMIFGTKNVLKWFFYILFYPLLLLFIFLPWFIFKQKSWNLGFAVVNATISFFKSLKYSFITTSFFLAALTSILLFNNLNLLWASIIILLVLIVVTFVRKFWFALKPSGIFGIHIKALKGTKKISKGTFTLDTDIRDLPMDSLNPKQLESWTAKLQTAVLFNRICVFLARKLRGYQGSPWQMMPHILTILFLLFFTVVSFTGINYGLYKINPLLFSTTGIPSIFTFFYYSFCNIVFRPINELAAIAPLSQIAFMTEATCALLLVAILVTLLIAVRSERNSAELDETIKAIEKEGEEMELFIKDEYKINTISDALSELEKLKAGFIKFLYKMSGDTKQG